MFSEHEFFVTPILGSVAVKGGMRPSLGQIVIYRLSDSDADAINRRRQHALSHLDQHRAEATGVLIHTGSTVNAGERYPMLVARVNNDMTINGVVFADGADPFWAPARQVGGRPGEWQFD